MDGLEVRCLRVYFVDLESETMKNFMKRREPFYRDGDESIRAIQLLRVIGMIVCASLLVVNIFRIIAIWRTNLCP